MAKTFTAAPGPPPAHLSPDDVATLADVAGTTARGWCVRYGLGSKIGGRWRVTPADLNKFLAGKWQRDRCPE